jgi:phosphonate degradation associated HDIG domain protein
MNTTIDTLLDLLAANGHHQYGQEAVSQLEHALQCATLAEAMGSSPELITACLLHDVGHLVHNLGEDAAVRGIDDRHEYRAMPLLQTLFSPTVTEPIRLHVEAKRYLCAIDASYWASLSLASQRSLDLQGGIFTAQAADEFIRQPHASEAAQLRLWDDQAKVPSLQTPDLKHFAAIMAACL